MTQYTHARWDQARARDDVIVLLMSSCARGLSNQFCPVSQSLGHQIHSNRWSITFVYLSTCVPKITCVFTVHVYLKWPKQIYFQLSKAIKQETCVQWCDLPPSPNRNQWWHSKEESYSWCMPTALQINWLSHAQSFSLECFLKPCCLVKTRCCHVPYGCKQTH